MLQASLKEGEIKGMKGSIEKLKKQLQAKYEKIAQFQNKNELFQERINKLKM
jgi:hypothetical protein